MLVLYLVFFLYQKEIMKFLWTTLLSNRLSFPLNRRNEQIKINLRLVGLLRYFSTIIKFVNYKALLVLDKMVKFFIILKIESQE